MTSALVPGMIAHRLPVVAALGARAGGDPLVDLLLEDVAAIGGPAGLAIDVRVDVLEDGLLEVEQRAGAAIELPQDARLADGEERLLGADVHRHLLVDLVEIQRFAGLVLEAPDQRAGVGVEPDGGGGVLRGVEGPGAAADRHPRLGLRDAPEREVDVGVVAAGDPRLAALPHHVGQVVPGVAARLAGVGHGVELPGQRAGPGVVGADEAALGLVALAAAEALDHLALHDDRAAGVGEALVGVGDHRGPHHRAGARVEGDHLGVAGGQEDLVVVDGDVAHAAGRRCRHGWDRPGWPRSDRRWRRRAPAPRSACW